MSLRPGRGGWQVRAAGDLDGFKTVVGQRVDLLLDQLVCPVDALPDVGEVAIAVPAAELVGVEGLLGAVHQELIPVDVFRVDTGDLRLDDDLVETRCEPVEPLDQGVAEALRHGELPPREVLLPPRFPPLELLGHPGQPLGGAVPPHEEDVFDRLPELGGTRRTDSGATPARWQPPARGNRVAVVTGAGGFGVMCADYIESDNPRARLQMAELSHGTVSRIRARAGLPTRPSCSASATAARCTVFCSR